MSLIPEPGPSPHRIVNPEGFSRPSGYAHAVAAAAGQTVYLAGQTGHQPDGALPRGGVAEEFDAAAANVVTALRAAGGEPPDLVSMQIFVTDLAAYQTASRHIGEAYRRHFGRHYVATALIEVKGLADGAAVEIVCVAVVPARG
jgi:enamine deaminase RidA (YjgF/YER057c/UK114 family)